MSYAEYRQRSAELAVRAWRDTAFRRQLIANPRALLRDFGIAVPDDVVVQIVEDTADTMHFVLPYMEDPDLIPSIEDLADPDRVGPMLCSFTEE